MGEDVEGGEVMNIKAQAYYTVNGKRAKMTWTEFEQGTPDKEVVDYFRQTASGYELEWVKVGKRRIYERISD